MSIDALRRHLASRQEFWDQSRIDALEARKREEIEFHNLDRSPDQLAADIRRSHDLHANRKWYWVTEPSRRYVGKWVGSEARGRVFLDYACGTGGMALSAARSGALLAVGLDISDESIRLARQAAHASRLGDLASFVQGDCESTGFPDSSFDRIICSGMLHHLDIDRAYEELRRILRPGGRILCVEALCHNPLIQAYRNRTPHMRTEWEARHVLGVQDALRGKKWFRLGEVRFWHLASLLAVPLGRKPLGRAVLRLGHAADAIMLRVPGVRRLAWQFTFVLEHPART